ncbi:hypothetical protein [Roseibacillus persicicus]|uniref:hypothetical protein n=1 Tax=Roseibacillus persicicus TaxID=454148 RepID=UPI00280F90C5|nr:hypothetical protein [Roseibacillus persicicus]MDQ8191318.1 hypothetical protein [Roseibacillus persicicus]
MKYLFALLALGVFTLILYLRGSHDVGVSIIRKPKSSVADTKHDNPESVEEGEALLLAEVGQLRDLVSRLGVLGAYETLVEENGEGEALAQEIYSLFNSSGIDFSEFVLVLASMKESHRSYAVSALFDRMARNNWKDIDLFLSNEVVVESSQVLEMSLEVLARGEFGSYSNISPYLESLRSYDAYSGLLVSSLQRLVPIFAEDIYHFSSEEYSGDELPNRKMGEVRAEALRHWVKEDSERALSYLEGSASAQDFQTAIQAINSISQRDARTLLSQYEDSENQAARDGALGVKALFLLAEGSLFEGAEVLGELREGAYRDYLADNFASASRAVVEKLISDDPEKFMEEVLKGGLERSSLWMTDGLEAWIEKDAEKAADWVSSRMSTIAPENTQYIAAVYAKEAASQGDISLAQQWADRILDTDTAAEIQEMISNAEASTQY